VPANIGTAEDFAAGIRIDIGVAGRCWRTHMPLLIAARAAVLMIVQQVPEGVAPIIICNVDHGVAAGQLAEAFGNAQFARAVPGGLLGFVARHHEEGWRPLDACPRRNPATGLPYHLSETPADLVIQKSIASPDFNERHHPWCGLLSSMHSWGLYHYRYGVSDAISIEQRPPAYAAAIAQCWTASLPVRNG
jgi:hypothetical protein